MKEGGRVSSHPKLGLSLQSGTLEWMRWGLWLQVALVASVLTIVVAGGYGWLFLRSWARHDWALDHLTTLLFLWQIQTGAAFALAVALIGSAVILDQTQAARRQEEERRHLDRKALATALLSEVNLLMKRLDQEEQNYRKLLEVLREVVIRKVARTPPFMGSGLESRVSVYAKCADQIGKLGSELADDLVNFHEFIDGVRDDAPRYYVDDTPPEFRIATLDGILNELWPEGLARGRALRSKLEAAAGA